MLVHTLQLQMAAAAESAAHTASQVVQNRWTGIGDVPAQTPLAVEVSKALKAKGFKFVGPVIVYAWMQAVGIVNDHLVTCHRHEPIRMLNDI